MHHPHVQQVAMDHADQGGMFCALCFIGASTYARRRVMNRKGETFINTTAKKCPGLLEILDGRGNKKEGQLRFCVVCENWNFSRRKAGRVIGT